MQCRDNSEFRVVNRSKVRRRRLEIPSIIGMWLQIERVAKLSFENDNSAFRKQPEQYQIIPARLIA
jgi:hypothetical protein